MPDTDLPATDLDAPANDSVLAEFLLFLREERRYWLAPLVLCLGAISAILVAAKGSAIAPFVYVLW